MATLIRTATILTRNNSDFELYTYYDPLQDGLPNTIFAFIANVVGNSNGTSYIEGELVIGMKNSPSNIDYSLNSNGDLIILTPVVEDADRYSIDNNGDLIYTIP